MLMQKIKLAVPLAVALALASVESNAVAILDVDLPKVTVFSNTYTTTGANSIVYGSILAGGNANIGGGTSKVYGNVVSDGVMTVGGATTVGLSGPNVTGSITSTGASTIGDSAEVGGDMLSGGVATTGANSEVGGSVLSNGAATTGDSAKVHGDVSAAGISTIGALSVVDGNVNGSGNPATNVISASATVGSQNNVTTSPDLSAVPTDVPDGAGQVKAAQAKLSALGVGTPLAATMTIDTTFAAGIYSAASFSTTKGTTMTLQGDGTDDLIWVFNIADVLAFGADTTITMSNVGANARVYWNSYNGYITSGAGADVIGTLLAHQYIAIGAHSTVINSENSCGAVYSATSYVSTGDSAKIGGLGCSPVVSVPEPATFGMLLSALAFLGFKRSRKG